MHPVVCTCWLEEQAEYRARGGTPWGEKAQHMSLLATDSHSVSHSIKVGPSPLRARAMASKATSRTYAQHARW
eukprot:scaffold18566_cov17-Tisochrysis_lutea.AAC.3